MLSFAWLVYHGVGSKQGWHARTAHERNTKSSRGQKVDEKNKHLCVWNVNLLCGKEISVYGKGIDGQHPVECPPERVFVLISTSIRCWV